MILIMLIINDKKIVVSTFLELKDILENDNTYNYIYLNNDIETLDNINILDTKKSITIDGTYESNMVTFINYDYKINLGINNKLIIKNINIINANGDGLFVALNDRAYLNTSINFFNITLNGTSLTSCFKSNITLRDSIIMLSEANGVLPTFLFQGGSIYISGNTTITSSSLTTPIFMYNAGFSAPKLHFLANSNVIISSSKELMGGTTKLDFKVLYGAFVNLTLGNGISPAPSQGCLDVLIDNSATLEFLENNHQRVPMWTIYNSLTILDNANLSVINNADNAPIDNYNIHFKGTSPKVIINNPKSVIFYTKNANVLYSDNPLVFTFYINRINMWTNSSDLTLSGTINTIPDYSFYNESNYAYINGTINKMDTTVIEHNLNDISNFSFNDKKIFSIGNSSINVYPIIDTTTSISGYTIKDSEVLIEYDNNSVIVDTDTEGFFTYNLTDTITDNTNIKITTCIPGSFIYETKSLVTPFYGELTLMESPEKLDFNLNPIGYDPYIFPRDKEFKIKVVDSRVNSSDFKIMAHLSNELKCGEKILEGVIIFKGFDNQITVLSTNKAVILKAKNNEGSPKVYTHTLSEEKGILLYLDNKYLELNSEYRTNIIWTLAN